VVDQYRKSDMVYTELDMNERQKILVRTALKVVHEGPDKRLDLREIHELVRRDFYDNRDRIRDFAIDIITDAIARCGEFSD
jgi:hypothetical protein